jgi:hypothetical protein
VLSLVHSLGQQITAAARQSAALPRCVAGTVIWHVRLGLEMLINVPQAMSTGWSFYTNVAGLAVLLHVLFLTIKVHCSKSAGYAHAHVWIPSFMLD